MKSSTKSSVENFEDADTRVHLAPEEADQPALKRRFMVKLVHWLAAVKFADVMRGMFLATSSKASCKKKEKRGWGRIMEKWISPYHHLGHQTPEEQTKSGEE